MAEQALITSWENYAATGERLLAGASRSLAIFDRDLTSLRLERPSVNASLARFLRASVASRLRIVIQDSGPLRLRHPRLLDLLRLFAHKFEVHECPPHLANLTDSLLLADADSALVRFHRDHARSKQIVADVEACKPYLLRFEDIWSERGAPVSATTTGL